MRISILPKTQDEIVLLADTRPKIFHNQTKVLHKQTNMLRNEHVSQHVIDVADLMVIDGASETDIKRLRFAARVIADLEHSVFDLFAMDENSAMSIRGLNKAVVAIIRSLYTALLDDRSTTDGVLHNPQSAQYVALIETIPAEILDLRQIRGLGIKTIARLYHEKGIRSVGALEIALGTTDGSRDLCSIKGIGNAKLDKLRRGISFYRSCTGKIDAEAVDNARMRVEDIVQSQAAAQGTPSARVALCGQAARGCELVSQIDLLIDTAGTPDIDVAACHKAVLQALGSTLVPSSLTLHQCLPEHFDAMRHRLSCDGAFYESLNTHATLHALTIDENGHLRSSDNVQEKSSTTFSEAELYQRLGLPLIPIEWREGEVDLATITQSSVNNLLCRDHLCGDLHMHSTASDGAHSIEEMADAAELAGYSYIAITDHTKVLAIANGLDEERLLAQFEDITDMQDPTRKLRVLSGTEVDILKGGQLDISHEVLAQLDWVNASVHLAHDLPKTKMTDRIIKAISSGLVDCIAHPTGRVLNQRPAYDVDLAAICDACIAYNVALELNASPRRLDLNATHLKMVSDKGVKIVVSSDAHHRDHIDRKSFALAIARRARLCRDQVLNTFPWCDLEMARKERLETHYAR